ncbi:MAG: polymer-forming cytoskeletal protein [Acidobacteriota bacterium]
MDFKKNRNESEIVRDERPSVNSETESYLGSTLKIKGNISSEEPVILEGKLTGNISSQQSITIGKSGTSSGRLEADYINIVGKAKGTIVTGKKLKIFSNAKFDGDITSTKVIIEEGGIFNGNMNMSEKKIR